MELSKGCHDLIYIASELKSVLICKIYLLTLLLFRTL